MNKGTQYSVGVIISSIILSLFLISFDSCKKEDNKQPIIISDFPIESHVDLDAGKDTLWYADGRKIVKDVVVKYIVPNSVKRMNSAVLRSTTNDVSFELTESDETLTVGSPANPITVGATKEDDPYTQMVSAVYGHYAKPLKTFEV
jgi:hypothetical protein